jgi:hypothetical protein
MSKNKIPTIDDIWGFDPEALHEDDLRYGYVIPEEYDNDVIVSKPKTTTTTTTTTSTTSKTTGSKTSTTSSYGWGGGSTYQRHNHDGDTVFTLFEGTEHEVEVGAASDHGKYVKEADVLVNCASSSWSHDDGTVSVYGGDFAGLNKYLGSGIETLGVKWSDGGKPPVPGSFFRDVIEAVKARGGGKVVFACVGGHGRTGTALAATLIANGVFDKAADAIEFVRKEHCYKACETKVQLEWLCALAGSGENPDDKGFPLHSYASSYSGGSSSKTWGSSTTSGGKGGSKSTTTKTTTTKTTTKSSASTPKGRAKGHTNAGKKA